APTRQYRYSRRGRRDSRQPWRRPIEPRQPKPPASRGTGRPDTDRRLPWPRREQWPNRRRAPPPGSPQAAPGTSAPRADPERWIGRAYRSIRERGPGPVPVGNDGNRKRPLHLKGRVVVSNPVRGLRHMRFGNQVTDFHIICESLKAMREPPGNVQLATVFRCKLEALPAAERRRVRSEVDDNVPDFSCDAAHQFHLAVRLALKMHAAQSAPPRRDRSDWLGKGCFP